MAVFNWTHGSIQFTTGSAKSLTLDLEAGGASVGEDQASFRDVQPVKVRGRFKGLLPGEDIEQDFSLESFLKADTLTDAAAANLIDILRKAGLYASDTTQDPYGYEWTLSVLLTMTDGTETGTITLPNWRPKVGISEAIEGNKLNISGTNYQQPTYT